MADLINLRQMRKQKKRQEKSATAEANRLSFGRKKAEKQLTLKEKIKAEKELDQKKLT